jgi:methionyl aminopeptidase
VSIETQADLEGITRVGRVVADTLRAMEAATRAGISTRELDAIGANVLQAHGARSAPQLLYGCPTHNLISGSHHIGSAAHRDKVSLKLRPEKYSIHLDILCESS